MLFKMLFIGYLFGVRSERQLIREIQVNVAYRWFLGLGLTGKVFDAHSFSNDGTDIERANEKGPVASVRFPVVIYVEKTFSIRLTAQ